MIRFIFRFIGLWLVAGAFVALVIDGTRTIAASRLVITPFRDTWMALHPTSLEALQKNVSGAFWDPVAVNLLAAPFWAVVGVLGILFLVIGRPRRAAAIGYSSRD